MFSFTNELLIGTSLLLVGHFAWGAVVWCGATLWNLIRLLHAAAKDRWSWLPIIAMVFMVSCSATEKIAKSANEVGEAAHTIIDQADSIQQTSGQPEVVTSAKKIRASAVAIVDAANKIGEEVTNVKNITPEWVMVIYCICGAIGLVAVCVILWQTKLGVGIRAAMSWIPVRKQQEATLAAQVLDPSNPAGAAELIAARRAADPLFNKAFVRAQASAAAVESPPATDGGKL